MNKPNTSLRLGLCCAFRDESIKFRNTTVKANLSLGKKERLEKLAILCSENAIALHRSIRFCADNGIGCFRVNSQVLPLKTHPECGYGLDQLPDGDRILAEFKTCGRFAEERNIRLCFHPDQFVVLNSPRPEVVDNSIRELEYQSEVAQWIGADVVNIHGGGAYGDKEAALDRFAKNLSRLSDHVRQRITLENDDTTYTPSDLLSLCVSEGIPLVYDVHHHRCKPCELSIADATEQAIKTWNREPMFHISSPVDGWEGQNPKRHHDFIDIDDFPRIWRDMAITVEVEARAKEIAVLKLRNEIESIN